MDSLLKLRSELAKFLARRYEVVSFEPGQARVNAGGRFPGFRLESYVNLELRRPGVKERSILHLKWGALGVECQGPVFGDDGASSTPGMQAVDSVTSLARIDVEIVVPLMESLKLHSIPDYSCVSFADSVVAVLLSRPPPDFVIADVIPELEYLEPIDESGEALDAGPIDRRVSCVPAVMCVPIGKDKPVIAEPPDGSRLGRGAFGYVWRARDTRTFDVYAVKAVPQRDLARERAIFQYCKGKFHPFIVTSLNFEHVEEVALCGIIMRLCAGGDLRDEVSKQRRIAEKANEAYTPPSASKAWAGQVYLGLEYLHIEVQMLVLDLKPDNVLLDLDTGRAQIADFGSSRLSTVPTRPAEGCPPGTPGFIGPELLRHEEYDYQADLYSFGALLWVLATGGIKERKKPQPPGAPMKSYNDWPALVADCQMLRDTVSGTWSAPFAEESAQDFVLSLCTNHSSERLTHEGIRAHPWMAPMHLPGSSTDSSAVIAWSDEQLARAAGQIGQENLAPIIDYN